MKISKATLINVVSERINAPVALVDKVIGEYEKAIIDAVSDGQTVSISNFGNFEPRRRAARTGRNPHKNEAVRIPSRVLPVFSPSTKFKENVLRGNGKK